jgi:two-component system, OmpR family, phosphate regulon response regulator PhoB
MKAEILIIEDDKALAELLEWNFSAEGYSVRQTGDGEEALVMVREQVPDAIILDWMIEHIPGIEVCRQIRKREETKSVPIIMLTARGEEEDRIRGLKTGADDYVTKPFSPRELLARVEALLRRSKPSISSEILSIANLELNKATHIVSRGSDVIKLGPTEYRMLLHFMERPSRIHSRNQLLDAIWGTEKDIDLRTVDVHIRRLRKAINRPGDKDLIRTVRSAGYSMDKH